MSKYNWKDDYFDFNGISVFKNGSQTKYISLLGRVNGTGSASDPLLSHTQQFTNANYILSGGSFDSVKFGRNVNAVGQGIDKTVIQLVADLSLAYYRDMTILGITGNSECRYIFCKISKDYQYNGSGTFSRCFMEFASSRPLTRCFLSKNSVIYPTGFASLNVIAASDVALDQTRINDYKNNYLAFDNCRFKIGNEADYLALAGDTEQELRNNFVARCTAQNIAVPDITEYNETLKVGRWVFAKESTSNGYVITDSIVDSFQKRKFITLGMYDNTVNIIPIRQDIASPASISSDSFVSYGLPTDDRLIVTDNSIRINESEDITVKADMPIESKVIWLGGKHKVTAVDILNNFQMQYGVILDNTSNISDETVTNVKADTNYVVRSSDSQLATITYNGITYTSSSANRNNVFRGISDINNFVDVSGNSEVYEVLDLAIQQTIQMRIVDDLPPEKITSGNLLADYWYYVTPDSLNDTNGYVTYNGVDYPCFSSFITSGSANTFVVNGACHLRRCWDRYFLWDRVVVDRDFWTDKQKPQWFDIVPNDLRCLMKNNSEYSVEMNTDENGNYIASGHSDFYNTVSGDSGVPLPAYPIQGVFMQLRLVVSTLNPV